MTKPVAISAISQHLQQAVDKLVDADEKNPNTRLSASDMRANPYRTASGNDGHVDQNEAKTVQDPFARSVFETVQLQEGRNIQRGGSDGFVPDILPAFRATRGEVRKLADHVEEIARRMDSDGDGKLTVEELENVGQKIDEFYSELYPARSQPRAKFKDRVAQLIREAFALEQES